MKFLNTELLGNPVNWIKVGLMSATFVLGIVLIAQLLLSEAAPVVDSKSPIAPQPGQT